MPRVGFEPTISAGERPKTYALGRAATVIGTETSNKENIIMCCVRLCFNKRSNIIPIARNVYVRFMAYLVHVVRRKLENKILTVIVDNNTIGYKHS